MLEIREQIQQWSIYSCNCFHFVCFVSWHNYCTIQINVLILSVTSYIGVKIPLDTLVKSKIDKYSNASLTSDKTGIDKVRNLR